MTAVSITNDYTMSIDTVVQLADGKTWDDVSEYSIKWNVLTITYKDGTTQESDLGDPSLDCMDFKWPDRTVVRPVNADDSINWDDDEILEGTA